MIRYLILFALGLLVLAGWRAMRRAPPAKMVHSEALDILGLEADASAEDIEAAYRRLMKRVHPDHGGSGGLARRLTEARNLLLNSD